MFLFHSHESTAFDGIALSLRFHPVNELLINCSQRSL